MKAWTLFTSILMLVMLLTGSITAIYAQAGGSPTAQASDVEKLRLKAEMAQKILNKLKLSVNVSSDLELEIERLLAVNVTSLSQDELKSFLKDVGAVLSEIRKAARSEENKLEKAVAARMLGKIEEKLDKALTKLNMTAEEEAKLREELRQKIAEALSGNITLREVRCFVKRLSEELFRHRVQNFTEQVLNYTEREMSRGRLHGLEVALNASSKVFQVLERVKERLQKVNASPVAIAAVEHAIEKIKSAREILRRLMMGLPPRNETGKTSPSQLRDRIRTVLEEKLEELNQTIRENLQRLRDLEKEAEGRNLTELVQTIRQSIDKLEALSAELKSSNLSFGEVMKIIACSKAVIARAEKALEKASEEEAMRSKVKEQLNKIAEKLEDKALEIKRKLNALTKGREKANESVTEAENLIQQARGSIQRGNLTLAEKLLNKARAALKTAEELMNSFNMGHKARWTPSR